MKEYQHGGETLIESNLFTSVSYESPVKEYANGSLNVRTGLLLRMKSKSTFPRWRRVQAGFIRMSTGLKLTAQLGGPEM